MNIYTITWTPEMLKRFKEAYANHKLEGFKSADVFRFDGNEYVMAYAAYLIEFLESKFK